MKKEKESMESMFAAVREELRDIASSVNKLETLAMSLELGASLREDGGDYGDIDLAGILAGEEEPDLIEEGETDDIPGILLFKPGRPYRLVDSTGAIDWILHLNDPCAVSPEDGPWMFVTERKNVRKADGSVLICGEMAVVAREDGGAFPMDAEMLCSLINFLNDASCIRRRNDHFEMAIQINAK